MKKLGIILAMEEEMTSLLEYFKESREIKIFDLAFHSGHIGKYDCVLVVCGIGKVNAARTAQIMIDVLNVDAIINVGVAGGLGEDLSIGDVIIAEALVQHDFDISCFGHERGYITGVGRMVESDHELVNLFTRASEKSHLTIKKGVIASGDIFCTDPLMAKKIHDEFNALGVEMEGAAIAQVCHLCKIPFVVLRSVSDTPNGHNAIDFDKFLLDSSKVVSRLLKTALEE